MADTHLRDARCERLSRKHTGRAGTPHLGVPAGAGRQSPRRVSVVRRLGMRSAPLRRLSYETVGPPWKIHVQFLKNNKYALSMGPGFPDSSAGKESACNIGDLGSIPGLGRSPGEGKGYPLQYSGLETSMDCIVHGAAKSWTRLTDFHFHM